MSCVHFFFRALCREEEDTFLRRGKPTTLLRFDDALEVEELKKKKKSPSLRAVSLSAASHIKSIIK